MTVEIDRRKYLVLPMRPTASMLLLDVLLLSGLIFLCGAGYGRKEAIATLQPEIQNARLEAQEVAAHLNRIESMQRNACGPR